MDKLITFPGVSDAGEAVVQALNPIGPGNEWGQHLVKTASHSRLHGQVQSFIRALNPDAGKLYVLVNALGSGEYYGANLNSDYFEEAQLNPGDLIEDYGYKTFYTARIHRNHRNKDPNESFGCVKLAVYNERMHRVELVVEIDRALAEKLGHSDLLGRLDRGDNVPVSMGCRVKADQCSICGNLAPTRAHYCEHAKMMMGQILPGGRKVYVRNPRPRFFELSFVVIGADSTSYSMLKVAQAHGYLGSSADAYAEAYSHILAEQLHEKLAARSKAAAILKRVPAIAQRIAPQLMRMQPTLPYSVLDRAARHPLPDLLGSARHSGMMLKPIEWQTVILIKIGRRPMARRLFEERSVFSPVPRVDSSIRIGGHKPLISGLLRPYSSGRGISGEALLKTAALARPVEAEPALLENDALLEKVASGYNGYRLQLLEESVGALTSPSNKGAQLLARGSDVLLEDALLGEMTKEARMVPAEMGLAALPFAFVFGTHERRTRDKQHLGPIRGFVQKHPVIAASMLSGLARLTMALTKNPAAAKAISNKMRTLLP